MSHFSLHPFFSSCSACALSPQCSGRWAQGVNWVKVISWARLGRPGLPSPAWTKTTTWQLGLYHQHISQDIFCTSFPIYLLKPDSHTCVCQSFRLGGRKNADIKTSVVFVGVALLLSHGLDLSHPPTHLHTTTFNLGLPKNPTQVSHCKVCA